MSLLHREWAAGFLRSAANIQKQSRTRARQTGAGLIDHNKERLRVEWRGLSTKRRTCTIEMSPMHLCVYKCLLDHGEDSDQDIATRTASVNQLILACGLSRSTIDSKLMDLAAVGFIERKRRANTSSITKIFRKSAQPEPPEMAAPELASTVSANVVTSCTPDAAPSTDGKTTPSAENLPSKQRAAELRLAHQFVEDSDNLRDPSLPSVRVLETYRELVTVFRDLLQKGGTEEDIRPNMHWAFTQPSQLLRDRLSQATWPHKYLAAIFGDTETRYYRTQNRPTDQSLLGFTKRKGGV